MDSVKYDTLQEENLLRFESVCMRCGRCCGSKDGDPCAKLRTNSDRRYYCEIYRDRLGPQKTVSGRVFNCVPIREMAKYGYARPDCAYNNARQ
ncbi:MAG: hypothetical protein HQ549_06145 [Candidatus Omnitrophica bacterium]|nr:hypothetical protein [Candidatus Omnitrophota bacterium]